MIIGLFSDTYTPEINGVVSSIVTLQQGLEAAGHTVYIITTHSSLMHISYENRVLRLPGIELKQIYGYVLSSPLHIRAYGVIKEMNLDIIHAHTEFGIGIFARVVSRLLHLPLVITYHTTYEDYTHYVNVFNSKAFEKVARKTVSQLSRVYIDTSDAIISPSSKTKTMLLGYGVKKDIHVVPTGLDLERFNPNHSSPQDIMALRSKLQIQEGRHIILYVGRIAREKSIDLVIQGFSKIDQNACPSHLIIVGGGPEEENLKKLAKELSISQLVSFVGKKPALEVPIYYHAAEAFVSASLTETQGMTFVEAFASHCPVFARPDDVLKELIREEETGYFFDTADMFAQKVQRHFELPESERNLMRQRVAHDAAPYERKNFIEKVMSVYRKALEDVNESMTLKSVLHNNDVVECAFIGRGERELTILVGAETFVKKGLRKGNTVNKSTIDELMSDEQFVKAYQACIRKLATKDRTIKEMYDYLTSNTTLSIREINTLIEHLEGKGYLNDLSYAQSMVSSLQGLLQGKNKIIQNLRKKGIPQAIIDQVIAQDKMENEVAQAIAWATKIKPTIHDRSLRASKQLLTQKMMHQGYDFNVIEVVMQSLNFADEEKTELENLRKAALKAKKRYASKYNGTALRNATFSYLDHQGYSLDDIYIILNEMEWNK